MTLVSFKVNLATGNGLDISPGGTVAASVQDLAVRSWLRLQLQSYQGHGDWSLGPPVRVLLQGSGAVNRLQRSTSHYELSLFDEGLWGTMRLTWLRAQRRFSVGLAVATAMLSMAGATRPAQAGEVAPPQEHGVSSTTNAAGQTIKRTFGLPPVNALAGDPGPYRTGGVPTGRVEPLRDANGRPILFGGFHENTPPATHTNTATVSPWTNHSNTGTGINSVWTNHSNVPGVVGTGIPAHTNVVPGDFIF